MKFQTQRSDFLPLLQRCLGIAAQKSLMPILSHVLLRAQGDTVTASATDLMLAVSSDGAAKVAEPGAVALPARDLFDRVKAMPDGAVSVAVDANGKATIKSGASKLRYTLHGVDGDEFPKLPHAEDVTGRTMPAGVIASALTLTHFAISADETRVHLNSALFEFGDGVFRVVTTDGHRLCKAECAATEKGTTSMLVPLKGIAELRKLCDHNPEAAVDIVASGANVFFDVAGVQFACKLVDATFPPYEQVIPDKSAHSVTVPRKELLGAVRAVSLAANAKSGGIRITIGGDRVIVESESPEAGKGHDEIDTSYTGPATTIGFAARYIVDVLAALDCDDVAFEFTGDLDPVVLRPGGAVDFLAVVMPMRV